MEITIGYVLSIIVIISLTALMVSFVFVYKQSLMEDYEDSAVDVVTSNIAHILTTLYIEGRESEYTPDLDEEVMLVRSTMILPKKIGESHYKIEINNSEKLICSSIKETCSPIIGLPLDFNISGEIESKKNLDISYWRKNNNTIVDYIIIDGS
jgi:hypothetical protein